ncbi:MAG: glycosyltransferase [Actinomycetota bacterium]
MTRVLHVADSMSSGVGAVVADIVREHTSVEHEILAYSRSEDMQRRVSGCATTIRGSRLSVALHALRRAASGEYDVFHFHGVRSSYVRPLVKLLGAKVAYSPHGYGFLYEDIPQWARTAVRTGERVLARFTDSVVAVGASEALQAQMASTWPKATVLPHAATSSASGARTEPNLVVTSGRIVPQKGPDIFEEIAVGLEDRATCVWVGDVDPHAPVGAGADGQPTLSEYKTGWLPPDVALSWLAAATVYLHTARWDGFPVVVCEAADLGVPVLVLETDSVRQDLPCELLFDSAADAAARVARCISDVGYRAHLVDVTTDWRRESLAARARQLPELYTFEGGTNRSGNAGNGRRFLPNREQVVTYSGVMDEA